MRPYVVLLALAACQGANTPTGSAPDLGPSALEKARQLATPADVWIGCDGHAEFAGASHDLTVPAEAVALAKVLEVPASGTLTVAVERGTDRSHVTRLMHLLELAEIDAYRIDLGHER